MFKWVFLSVCGVLWGAVASAAVSFDANGVPVYPEWEQKALDELAAKIKAFDSDGTGLTRDVIRKLYKGVGTNDLQKGLDALVKSGKLTMRTVRPPSGKVAYETWFAK